MDVWRDSIFKALDENQQNIDTNANYRKAYEDLAENLQYFNETLSPSIMVPICSRVFMRGNLVHTNEILVSLGCGYFAETSTKKAVDICKRRVSEAEKTLQSLKKEAQLLNDRLNFLNSDALNSGLQEIVETYNEEAEKKWRVARKDKLVKSRRKETEELDKIDDKDLMEKLQLLELQEEMEPFQDQISNDSCKKSELDSEAEKSSPTRSEDSEPNEFEIRKKLADLRQRKKTQCLTEEDVFKRLDELDEEEQLEHELDKYYEKHSHLKRKESDESSTSEEENYNEDQNEPDKESVTKKTAIGEKRVSFAESELESHTVSINFKHSETPSTVTNPNDEIQSPSDIYKSFPQNSDEKGSITKPIIKNCHKVMEETHLPNKPDDETESKMEPLLPFNIIGNVVEHKTDLITSSKNMNNSDRPMSQFKKMRQKTKK